MKSLLFIPSILLLASGIPDSSKTKIYICTGKGSKRYHYEKSCRGLSRCSSAIKTVTLEKAQTMGRTLCGWEDQSYFQSFAGPTHFIQIVSDYFVGRRFDHCPELDNFF